jgi:fucose 4-O-acetylase-like acetyltransferase
MCSKKAVLTKKERLSWIDAAKGFTILLVVVFHTTALEKFIGPGHLWDVINCSVRWFHMPIFFLIAGFLFNPKKGFFKKVTTRYLLSCIIILILIYGLFGGDPIAGEYDYVVLWFPISLFIAEVILFSIYKKYIYMQILIVILLFLIAPTIHAFTLPRWGIDASFIAVYYVAVGHWLKPYLTNNKLLLACLPILLIALWSQWSGYAVNGMDMKHFEMSNIYFMLTIPIIASIVIINFIRLIYFLKIFQIFGKHSMLIMYLHIPIFSHSIGGLYDRTAIAVLIPIIIGVLIPKYIDCWRWCWYSLTHSRLVQRPGFR